MKTKQFNKEAMPYYNEILKTAINRVYGNVDKGKDLTQDVYIKAWQSWNTYQLDTNCRAWLHCILKHKHFDMLRSNYSKVMNELLEADRKPKLFDYIEDEKVLTPLDEVIKKEREREVYFAIVALPQQYYDVMFPLTYHGLNYKQIAEQIGYEEGTVKSRVFRARDILRKTLKHLSLETA